MTLTLRPEIVRLVDDQVKDGRFSTREEAVEAAIVKAYHPDDIESDLDEKTIAAINEGEEQGDRGEGILFEEVRAYWHNRLNRR